MDLSSIPGANDADGERIRSAVRRMPVDPALRAKVRESVEKARRPAPYRQPSLWLALSVVFALLLMVLDRIEAPLRDLSQLAVNQHAACAVARILPVRPIDASLDPIRMRTAERTPDPFRVLDAHVCDMSGRSFLHLVLGLGANRISLLIIDLRQGEKPAPRWAIPIPRGAYRVSSEYSATRAIFLVSDLPMAVHENLARSLDPRAILAGRHALLKQPSGSVYGVWNLPRPPRAKPRHFSSHHCHPYR